MANRKTLRRHRERRMDKFFANVYRGDPGIPHANPDKFADIWIASAIFSACAWNNPYMWRLSNKFNWHDHAMLYEQYHLKKAMEKKQPYEYLWNKMPPKVQHAYYINWPTYFP